MKNLLYKYILQESDSNNKDEISVPLILNNDDDLQINLTVPNSKSAKSITEAPIILDKDGTIKINKNEILKFFQLIDFSTAK